jgi:hypothetical protein
VRPETSTPARRRSASRSAGVDRGRRDDDLEVRALRQQLLEIAQQEIDVEAALVRLVDDDRVVGAERAIGDGLGEQDAVGHQLDRAALRRSPASWKRTL